MSDKGISLRGVAISIVGQLPDDYDDAMRIMRYMVEMLEWKFRRKAEFGAPAAGGEPDNGNQSNGNIKKTPENQCSGATADMKVVALRGGARHQPQELEHFVI
jgi:hypothetical protein